MELTEEKRGKTEQKEGDDYKRNINDSGVFRSIAVKYMGCNLLRSHQRLLEKEVKHVPLWLADPISDGN